MTLILECLTPALSAFVMGAHLRLKWWVMDTVMTQLTMQCVTMMVGIVAYRVRRRIGALANSVLVMNKVNQF